MLLRLGLALRALIAPTRRLRLASRLRIARRGSSVSLALHRGSVGAANAAAASALASAAGLRLPSAAASPLGEQVLGDLRLGIVIVVGRDRREPLGTSGHPDLGVPDRAELVGPNCRRGGRGRLFEVFDILADGRIYAQHLRVHGSATVAATATTAAPATMASFRRLVFGLLTLAEILSQVFGVLLDHLGAGIGRPNMGQLLAGQSYQLAA
jgi:hypothetical protein